MASFNSGLQFDPFPALEAETFKRLFALEEMANRTIEGGWELLFRNLLIRELQGGKYFSLAGLELDRETTVVPRQGDGKRKEGKVGQEDKAQKEGKAEDKEKICDIAVLGADGNAQMPRAIFELKHNFATQSEVFRELRGAIQKWRGWGADKHCEFHFIQIVTDIHQLAGKQCGNDYDGCCVFPEKNRMYEGERCKKFCSSVCAEVFKYGIQPDQGMRKGRMEAICAHFNFLQKCADPGLGESARLKSFSVASEKYFLRDISYSADVHVFLVSQRAGISRDRCGSLLRDEGFPNHTQVALLNFSKGRNGQKSKKLSLQCPEPP